MHIGLAQWIIATCHVTVSVKVLGSILASVLNFVHYSTQKNLSKSFIRLSSD